MDLLTLLTYCPLPIQRLSLEVKVAGRSAGRLCHIRLVLHFCNVVKFSFACDCVGAGCLDISALTSQHMQVVNRLDAHIRSRSAIFGIGTSVTETE